MSEELLITNSADMAKHIAMSAYKLRDMGDISGSQKLFGLMLRYQLKSIENATTDLLMETAIIKAIEYGDLAGLDYQLVSNLINDRKNKRLSFVNKMNQMHNTLRLYSKKLYNSLLDKTRK
jgi:hypothetical protein